jgi:hypothetical protein
MFSFRRRAISVRIAMIATQLGDFIKFFSLPFGAALFILSRLNATAMPKKNDGILAAYGNSEAYRPSKKLWPWEKLPIGLNTRMNT